MFQVQRRIVVNPPDLGMEDPLVPVLPSPPSWFSVPRVSALSSSQGTLLQSCAGSKPYTLCKLRGGWYHGNSLSPQNHCLLTSCLPLYPLESSQRLHLRQRKAANQAKPVKHFPNTLRHIGDIPSTGEGCAANRQQQRHSGLIGSHCPHAVYKNAGWPTGPNPA